MQQLYDQIARVAPTSATVLLIGESGTGKELAARTIHDLSKRKRAPFLAINCGAISPQLIESELFGHERGSFTGADRQHKGFFERANGGTLLLDEITEMPLALQVKLLRVLETGTFVRVGTTQPIATDVRIIAATNSSPARRCRKASSARTSITGSTSSRSSCRRCASAAPTSRCSREHFLDELNATEGTSKRFAPAAIVAPVRPPVAGQRARTEELRAARLHHGRQRDRRQRAPRRIAAGGRGRRPSHRAGRHAARGDRAAGHMATLARCNNVKKRAAEVLGISLKTLYNRLEVYAQKDKAEAEQRHPEVAH